jgi:hypothetical protein
VLANHRESFEPIARQRRGEAQVGELPRESSPQHLGIVDHNDSLTA